MYDEQRKRGGRLRAALLTGAVVCALTACAPASNMPPSTPPVGLDGEGAGSSGSEAETEVNAASASVSDAGAADAELEAELAAVRTAEQRYFAVLPESAEVAELAIAPIEGLPERFICGMDVSSVIAEEESGVVYRDRDGAERELLELLADAGINYIRVRVWNHPYDAEGHGYGGGNNDAARAAEIGRRAAECGLRLCVDFHYSDFWADPGKQYAPAEWESLDVGEKAERLGAYTEAALTQILASGADVGMVQIGNEINNGLCGVSDEEDVMRLLAAASTAVRKVAEASGRDLRIVIHYTDVNDATATLNRAKALADHAIDYDVFGISYYPYWHGSMEQMRDVLRGIGETFGVETCVMETAYPYTREDGDGFRNSVESGGAAGYPDSVEGQASCVRDIAAYAAEAGALGIFYWEGAWVPVGSDAASNREKWETYGSGWASSYAASYDPQDAGRYYGGCSWDNQAMFDREGRALASLYVFSWLRYGTETPSAGE